VLPELFNPGDDFWNLDELFLVDETRPSADASSIVLEDGVASTAPVLPPTGGESIPASQRLPPTPSTRPLEDELSNSPRRCD
jgi:hypothetical protein